MWPTFQFLMRPCNATPACNWESTQWARMWHRGQSLDWVCVHEGCYCRPGCRGWRTLSEPERSRGLKHGKWSVMHSGTFCNYPQKDVCLESEPNIIWPNSSNERLLSESLRPLSNLSSTGETSMKTDVHVYLLQVSSASSEPSGHSGSPSHRQRPGTHWPFKQANSAGAHVFLAAHRGAERREEVRGGTRRRLKEEVREGD